MKGQKELFEFLCKLVDIQIKKYVSLAQFGVGPDARLNAKLVFDEVNELLGFAEQLLSDLEKQSKNKSITSDTQCFAPLFNQIKFYIEQEHARAYAGWLLSENNIHTEVKERVEEQLTELKRIGQLAGIDCSTLSEPKTEIQKQCEYDSIAIAFYILDIAKKIKENPGMELPGNIPQHARIILRHNAETRYCSEEIASALQSLHKKYSDFLRQSELQKSSNVLSKEDAEFHQKNHRAKWLDMFQRYAIIAPSSPLLSSEHEWYKVALLTKKKPESNSSCKLFGGIIATSALAIYMLMSYFSQLDNEHVLSPVSKF